MLLNSVDSEDSDVITRYIRASQSLIIGIIITLTTATRSGNNKNDNCQLVQKDASVKESKRAVV